MRNSTNAQGGTGSLLMHTVKKTYWGEDPHFSQDQDSAGLKGKTDETDYYNVVDIDSVVETTSKLSNKYTTERRVCNAQFYENLI